MKIISSFNSFVPTAKYDNFQLPKLHLCANTPNRAPIDDFHSNVYSEQEPFKVIENANNIVQSVTKIVQNATEAVQKAAKQEDKQATPPLYSSPQLSLSFILRDTTPKKVKSVVQNMNSNAEIVNKTAPAEEQESTTPVCTPPQPSPPTILKRAKPTLPVVELYFSLEKDTKPHGMD